MKSRFSDKCVSLHKRLANLSLSLSLVKRQLDNKCVKNTITVLQLSGTRWIANRQYFTLPDPQMKHAIKLKSTIFLFHASIIVMRTQFNSFCKGESMHYMNPCNEKCSLSMGLLEAVASKFGVKWGCSLSPTLFTLTIGEVSDYIEGFSGLGATITICWWYCAHVELLGGTRKTSKCLNSIPISDQYPMALGVP